MANVFDVLKKINLDDIQNKSRNLASSNTVISLNQVSAGFELKMGLSHEAGMALMSGKARVISLVIDNDEFKKVENELNEEVNNG